MWLKNRWVQQHLGGGWLERKLIGLASFLELEEMGGHKDADTLRLIQRIRRERQSLLTANESFILYSTVVALRRLPGDLAEVGVFQGASAKLICEAKNDRTFHLFDTFRGLPLAEGQEKNVFHEHQYACSLPAVKEYLGDYPNVLYHQGIFPASTQNLDDLKFSFVHLDVDLYRSTLDCLEFFYPRLVAGGIAISHDYSIFKGVRNAFDHFLADRPECVIELPTTQCMLVKQHANETTVSACHAVLTVPA